MILVQWKYSTAWEEPDDDWQGPLQGRSAGRLADRLAGQLVWGFPRLQLERRETYEWGDCTRVSEEEGDGERAQMGGEREEERGERWIECGASDLLCCCLGILNKHIYTPTVSPTFCSSCQADHVKAHSGGLRQPNTVGAPFFISTTLLTQLSKEIKVNISRKNLLTRSAQPL